jgi:hypothetical protein
MHISYIGLAIFLFLTASLHAKLEIEIEGKHGWAEKLPTKKFSFFVTKYLSEHNYITGFHFFNVLLIFGLFHFPIFFVPEWTINYELFVIGFTMLHFTLEDFLWFVYNPAFGLRKFKKKNIWWHKNWFLGLPVSFWFAIPVGIALLFFIRV